MFKKTAVFNLGATLILSLGLLGLWNCSTEDMSDPDGDSDSEAWTDGEEADAASEEEIDAEEEGAESEEEAAEPWRELPHALCGMASYDLLDPKEMGEVLSVEEVKFFDMTASEIDSALEAVGYTQLSPVPYGCRVFRYRYTTQDKGRTVEATALLGVPANGEIPAKVPFNVFLHGTTGFADVCAPGRGADGQAQAALLGSLGFVSVLPDYIGLASMGDPSVSHHGYLVGEQTAIGSWDALRAAEKLIRSGTLADVPADLMDRLGVVWGGSQGGHAALFTGLYGAYYADEYHVAGISASVPPTDVLALAHEALTHLGPPSISMIAVLATMKIWYGAPADYSGVFTNEDPLRLADNVESVVFMEGQDKCETPEGLSEDLIDGLEDIYAPAFLTAGQAEDWDALGPFGCYLSESTLRLSAVPPRDFPPTFVTFSEMDDLVVTAPMREDFDRLCEAGYPLWYLECAGAGHSEGAVWSLPEQLAFLKARLAEGWPRQSARWPAEMCQRSAPTRCSATPEER